MIIAIRLPLLSLDLVLAALAEEGASAELSTALLSSIDYYDDSY